MLKASTVKSLGHVYENMAKDFLQNSLGHKIISQNFKILSKEFKGEIDIISQKDGILYINEVKKRSFPTSETFTHSQQERLLHTFQHFCTQNKQFEHLEFKFQFLLVQHNTVQIIDIL